MTESREQDLSHRQEREQKKAAHKMSTPGENLSSRHPAWYVVIAVVFVGLAVLIWTLVLR